MIVVKWKLKQFLDNHNLTPYRLIKESKLSPNTVYVIAQGKGDRIDLHTLGAILETLASLTGQPVGLNDILDVIEA